MEWKVRLAVAASACVVAGIPAGTALGQEDGTGSLTVDFGGGAGVYEGQGLWLDDGFRDVFRAGQLGARYRFYYWPECSIGVGVRSHFAYVTRAEGSQDGNGQRPPAGMSVLQHEAAAPYSVYGVQPYVAWEHWWIAVHSGYNFVRDSNRGELDRWPGFYLRMGPERTAFFETSLWHDRYPFAAAPFKIGGGWKLSTFGSLRMGLALPWASAYVLPTFFIPAGDYRLDASLMLVFSPDSEVAGDTLFFVGLATSLEVPLHR